MCMCVFAVDVCEMCVCLHACISACHVHEALLSSFKCSCQSRGRIVHVPQKCVTLGGGG